MTGTKRNQPEFRLQCVVAELLRFQGRPGLYWTAIPNGEERPKRRNAKGQWYSPTGERLKRMGLRAGNGDLLLVWRGKPIMIELKVKGGSQSDNQIQVEKDWEAAGGWYFVCTGYAETVDLLMKLDCIRPVQGHERFEPRSVTEGREAA